jgi:hypothetical protein
LNSREQAKQIYPLCVDRAKLKQTLSYGDVLKSLGYKKGVAGHAIRYGLELVLIACADNHLPMLTCIVVCKDNDKPSDGGYRGVSWEEDSQKVFSHKDWLAVDEIDWDLTWRNRKLLSAKYGTPGYWDQK